MGRITEVHYEAIPAEKITPMEAGQFYFYHNLLDSTEMFHADYEANEAKQIALRNGTIGDAIRRGDIEAGGVNVAASFLGISSLKNKVVLVAELK